MLALPTARPDSISVNRYKSLRRTPWPRVSGTRDPRESQERAAILRARLRAGGRCEVSLTAGRVTARCGRPDQETHHVIKRSQGGKYRGEDYLVRVCRVCHALTDAAPSQMTTLPSGNKIAGKLKIVAKGGGKFRCYMDTVGKSLSRRA